MEKIKTKIVETVEKAAEWTEDHAGGILIGITFAVEGALLLITGRSVRLQNKKTALEIQQLQNQNK